MKIYDKEMYAKDKAIKSVLLILIVFIIGFAAGCVAVNKELEKKIKDQEAKIIEQYIELDSLRETVYMYEIYGK